MWIKKHLTIDPCYGALYYGMSVLIDNLCLRLFYAYGWLSIISLDDLVNTNLMICEAPGQSGIKASAKRSVAYDMNTIERVSKKGNHVSMDTPDSTSQPITLTLFFVYYASIYGSTKMGGTSCCSMAIAMNYKYFWYPFCARSNEIVIG